MATPALVVGSLLSLDFPIERCASAARFCVSFRDGCLHLAACPQHDHPPMSQGVAEQVSRSPRLSSTPRTPDGNIKRCWHLSYPTREPA